MLKAQYQRAEQLPSAHGEFFAGGNDRAAVDADDRLYFRTAVVNTRKKKTYEKPDFRIQGQDYGNSREAYSPNHHYIVITHFDAWNYPAKKGNRKPPRADWMTTVRTVNWEQSQYNAAIIEPWSVDFYDDNFVLAITSTGKLITTDPGKITDIRGPHQPGIKHINGLYLVDPRNSSKQTITTDKIDTRDVYSQWYFLSKDESSIVMVLSHKISSGGPSGEVIRYNINTGARTGFTSQQSLLPVMAGNNLLMTYGNSKDPAYSDDLKIFRINDGKLLGDIGLVKSLDVLQFDMRGDSVFYFNKDNYTLATFVPGKDELELYSLLNIDTANLGFAPIDYNLTVLNNQFALVPREIPKDHWERRTYAGYLMLFDRKHASPQFAVKPFFHDPKTAANNLAAQNRAYRAACEKLKKETPYAYGTLLRRKTGSDGKPVIFIGADCPQDKYLIKYPGSTLVTGFYNYQLAQEFVALGPEHVICNACSGNGKITESFTSADDGWTQTNFNVYVRVKGKTKTETITSECKKCLGKGYHKH
jgi:hypothetical protein